MIPTMPGCPKRMAERATQLEAMAYVCAGEVFLAAPKRYLPTNDPDDPPGADPSRIVRPPRGPVAKHWRACITLSQALHIASLELANLLRAKAGLEPIVNDDDEPPEPDNGKLELPIPTA